jgi:hypothetical protein
MVQDPQPRLGRLAFHADHDVDRLMAMLAAMTQELAVLRERLDTHERLLDGRGLFGPADVDVFKPSDAASVERQHIRQRLIASVFRPVFTMAEPAGGGDADYEQFVQSLETSTESRS